MKGKLTKGGEVERKLAERRAENAVEDRLINRDCPMEMFSIHELEALARLCKNEIARRRS